MANDHDRFQKGRFEGMHRFVWYTWKRYSNQPYENTKKLEIFQPVFLDFDYYLLNNAEKMDPLYKKPGPGFQKSCRMLINNSTENAIVSDCNSYFYPVLREHSKPDDRNSLI